MNEFSTLIYQSFHSHISIYALHCAIGLRVSKLNGKGTQHNFQFSSFANTLTTIETMKDDCIDWIL